MIFVEEIYQRYQILPNLREHMLTTAKVGQVICQQFIDAGLAVDEKLVVVSLLLHDIGNLVKFKRPFSKFSLAPELQANPAKWEAIQADFWQKYGRGGHTAGMNMLIEMENELGLDSRYRLILEEMKEFSKITDATIDGAQEPSLEARIILYADCLVAPRGIVSLKERLDDLQSRYEKPSEEWREPLENNERELLKLLGQSRMNYEDLTEKVKQVDIDQYLILE